MSLKFSDVLLVIKNTVVVVVISVVPWVSNMASFKSSISGKEVGCFPSDSLYFKLSR